METLEVETRDGWMAILAKVRAVGKTKFRAEIRLPTPTSMATARLRYGGKNVKHVLIETKATSWPRVAIAVVDFEIAED